MTLYNLNATPSINYFHTLLKVILYHSTCSSICQQKKKKIAFILVTDSNAHILTIGKVSVIIEDFIIGLFGLKDTV